jgi:hypothetical protein
MLGKSDNSSSQQFQQLTIPAANNSSSNPIAGQGISKMLTPQ